MMGITNIEPEYLQVYNNYDQFSDASNSYIKGEDHVCYIITENEVIYWIALENVWRPLNVVTTSAGNIEGIDNPVNVTLRIVDGGMIYTRVPNIPDAERIINIDNFLTNYPQIEYLDFTGNINTVSMRKAFADSNIKDAGNINFDKVEDITNIFSGCANFDNDYSLTINSCATSFTCTDCVKNSNLPELIINIPNVNIGEFTLLGDNQNLKTNLIINYNDTFQYDLSNYNHYEITSESFGFSSDTDVNRIKCPKYIIGYRSLDSISNDYYYDLPSNLECELFISKTDGTYNELYPNVTDQQFNIKTKHVLFDYFSTNNTAIKLSNYFDIIYDQDTLQDIKILNEGKSYNYVYDNSGIRIDLSKIKQIDNSNAILYQGFVYSGDNAITLDTIKSFPVYESYGFPYFKNLELSELQDSNVDNSVENKSIYCAFTDNILPYKKEIEDKTKLGTHTFKDIDYAILELNNIPNITLESSSEKNTELIEYDNADRKNVALTNNFNLTGTFEINTNHTIKGMPNLFLGSKINYNNVIFNVTGITTLYVCVVGEDIGQENNTVFDSKYDYQFSLQNSSNIYALFALQSHVNGPQVSIDKLAINNMIYANILDLPAESCNERFLYAKYDENLSITINRSYINTIDCWSANYIDFYYKYFNNSSKPIIIDTEASFNCKNALYCENSDAKEALMNLYDYTSEDFENKSLKNQEEYNTYLQEATTLYVNCTENGSICINIYCAFEKSKYYDYYLGFCRRTNNIQYIYGNVTLSCKIQKIYPYIYNNLVNASIGTLTREGADGIISCEQNNEENHKSSLKHIDVTKALKGYWDIRFMPDLDQETVKSIVNNLEVWDGDDKQDFNLYRYQFDYLTKEEQELLNTKNYNVRITEYETEAFYTCDSSGTLQNNFTIYGSLSTFTRYIYIKSHDSNGTKIPVTMKITGASYGYDKYDEYLTCTIEEIDSDIYDYRIKIVGDGLNTPLTGGGISYDATLTQTGTQNTYNFTFKINI